VRLEVEFDARRVEQPEQCVHDPDAAHGDEAGDAGGDDRGERRDRPQELAEELSADDRAQRRPQRALHGRPPPLFADDAPTSSIIDVRSIVWSIGIRYLL